MAKKYVVEGAEINCQYGAQTRLIVPGDRHIEAAKKRMGNETDYSTDCFESGGFGSCISPHINQGMSQDMHDLLIEGGLNHLQQMGIYSSGVPCEPYLILQWMETKEDVYIGQYRALLEDSWVFCKNGMGFLTFLNSGQQENAAELLAEQLNQLEAVVNAYVKEKGLSENQKNDLINSIVLWNGYSSVPWDSKVSQELWDFGIYMDKNHPILCNFFERGIYLSDPQTGDSIDVSYMAGISLSLNDNQVWTLINEIILEDQAAFNGYLEAARLGKSSNGLEAMERFLQYINSPDYDSKNRFTDYFDVGEDARAQFDQMYRNGTTVDGIYYLPEVPPEYNWKVDEILKSRVNWMELNQDEKNQFILKRKLADLYNWDFSDYFMNLLYDGAGKE